MEDSTSVTVIEVVLVLLTVPGFLVAMVWLLGGRKRVAGWCGTLWRAMVRAWLSRWVPFVVRVKVTVLIHRHGRVFRKGQRSEYIRRYDAAQDFFEGGAKALRQYVLDHGSVLKTTTRERYTLVWVGDGPYAGLWNPDPWGRPFITSDHAFLEHVRKIRTFAIVDSWPLAALHWWLRSRQTVAVKWKAARLRRRIVRTRHEARRNRVIHCFAWPTAPPFMVWLLWQLIAKGLAP